MLPQDIILIICEELGLQADFATLYNLALSGRFFAGSALLWMYRVHNQSSIRGGESDQTEIPRIGNGRNATPATRMELERNRIARWSLHWKSIVLSSLGKTLFPYSLYIRSLDLDNLGELLDDLIRHDRLFQEHSLDDFFQGDMQLFFAESRSTRSHISKLPTNSIVETIGECISKYIGDQASANGGSGSLEELRCRMPRTILPRCVSRLSRLKEIHVYDGAVLDKMTATALRTYCPDFEKLNLYVCQGGDADSDIASFLANLRPNSLCSFHVSSRNDIASQTFIALNSHRDTLKELWLSDLSVPSMLSLQLIGGCAAVESLKISTAAPTLDLEAAEDDVYLGIVAWLTSCTNLKEVELTKLVNGPSILSAVCLESSIYLRSLSLKDYTLVNSQTFHQALAQQTSLESLELTGDSEDAFRADIDTLVSSICRLKNLTYLNLPDISSYFRTTEIERIAYSLSKLESFSVGGYDILDDVLPSLATLRYLKQMTFYALTTFTYSGILKFIMSLTADNAGFSLNIMYATVESDLKPREITSLRQALTRTVGGTFEFTLYREPSDSSSDSD